MTGARSPRRVPPRVGRSLYLRTPSPPPPINGYSVSITDPVNGATAREARPTISFIPTSVLGDAVDVQVEWRTQAPYLLGSSWEPKPTHIFNLTGLGAGFRASHRPGVDLSYTSWHYRMRAGSAALGVWSSWTASRYINIQPVLGSVAEYVEMNIGVSAPTTLGALAYVDMNVGANFQATNLFAEYAEINVGIEPKIPVAASYVDFNVYPPFGPRYEATYADMNVTTGQPSPMIWWVRPDSGREGYIFHIYGHGFGSFQGRYNGTVRLGALLCPVLQWSLVPDSSSLMVPKVIVRGQGAAPDEITVEHGWITVVVPVGAVSSMVRVVLEG